MKSAPNGRTRSQLRGRFLSHNIIPGLTGFLDDHQHPQRLDREIARSQSASGWSSLVLLLLVAIVAGCQTNTRMSQTVVKPEANPVRGSTSPETNAPLVLDIARFYTDSASSPDSILKSFSGRQWIDGLPFQVDGQAFLYGQTMAERRADLPDALQGIRIGRKFDELYLIHHVKWPDVEGQTVAFIRLNYVDGTKYEFPIRYGSQVRDWYRLPSEEKETLTDPDTKVCWRRPPIEYKAPIRLFETKLLNPHPEKLVETMDVISARHRSTYALVAATVADRDPHRPITPPVPPEEPDRHFDGAVTIRVVDKTTEQPLPGALLDPGMDVNDEGVVGNPINTSTTGQGTIRYPIKQTSSLDVSVTRDGYTGKTVQWPAGSIPSQFTFRLVPATARIGGIVLGESGQPVANAEVHVQNYNLYRPGEESTSLGNLFTRTDATGSWTIQGIPDGFQDFGITVTHPDFPQAQLFADGPNVRRFGGQHIPAADFFKGLAVLKMSRGGQLTGTVRDASGKPVAGASVFVGVDRFRNGAVNETTDSRGSFRLKNLGLGENYLTTSAPGFAPEFRSITVTATNTAVDIVLKPGRVVSGRVVDTAGRPLAGAQVSYDGLADRMGIFSGRSIQWNEETGPDGRFTWNSAPLEPVNLSIRKDGYMASLWNRVDAGATNEATFTLGRPLTVHGSVTDAVTGQAIDEFKVVPGWPENGGVHLQKRDAKPGAAGHYQVRLESPIIIARPPYDFVFQISAMGYAPAQSRPIKPDEGDVVWDVQLERSPASIVQITTPNGSPAPGVTVLLLPPRAYLQISGMELRNQSGDGDSFETDSNGVFELPPQDGDFVLAAASPAGFGLVQKAGFTNSPTMKLQPWGRVEGVLLNNGRPMAGQELYFFAGDGMQNNVWSQQSVPTDAQGHFVFPLVPPGTIRLELKQPMTEQSWSYVELESVEVGPGETNTVDINFHGRPVIGHLQWDATGLSTGDFTACNIALQPEVTPPQVPKEMDTPEKVQEWYRDWMKTDDGKKYSAALRKRRQAQVKLDGTFRMEAVEPGKYQLGGALQQNGSLQAQVDSQSVVVPEAATNDADTPFDIGVVTLKKVKHLNVGDVAPEFSVKTLEDQPLKLSAFHGKFVLVDFWATWCGPCVAETPHLKATYDTFGKDARFVMISLSLDQSVNEPRKFAQDKDIKWLQGFLGEWSKDGVTKDYGVYGIPAIFLISPDGKIIAQNLRGGSIQDTVASALSAK